LKADLVAYRIKKLQEKNILKKFITIIDEYKLGFTELRFYLNYQFPNPKIKHKIIDYFTKFKFCRVVASIKGEYELLLIMAVKNMQEFYKSWGLVLNKYREYFSNFQFSVYFQENRYKFSFLLEQDKYDIDNRLKFSSFGSSEKVKVDDLDLEILRLIATNARLPSIEIASILTTSARTISKRIKNLIKIGIIKGFSIELDYTKFEYKQFKANILLKKHKDLYKIINYVERNPNLVAIFKTVGYVDIELGFNFRNINGFYSIMEDLTEKFPDLIKSYTYMTDCDTHKWEYFN
jgi:Lrp/AsnC family transcriptional regulator for asnA, asnC and gidA